MVQTSHGTGGAVFGPEPLFQRGAAGLWRALGDRLLLEREQWALWSPVALGAGIACWFAMPGPQLWLATLAVSLGSALLCWRLGVAGRLLGWAGLLVAAGLCLAWARAEAVRAPVFSFDGAAREVAGQVESRETLADGRERLVIRVASIAGLDADETPAKVRVTSRKPLNPAATRGARVRFKAWLQPPPGPAVPGGYDFGQRAWFEGLGGVGSLLGRVVVERPAIAADTGLMDRVEAARTALSERLRERIGGEAGGMAAALVTGDRSGIPEDVTEAMRDSGLAHLVSISGLHIGLVTTLVFLLTRRLLALSPWLALRLPLKTIAALMAALAAVGYTLIAGAGLPTVRSCIATLIVLAGILIGRQTISLRLVAAGAFLILLFRPEALLNPSFQLSFAAVTGLVALYQSRLARRWLRRQEGDGWGRRLMRWSAALILSSLVAEAMLAPIAIAHFNQTGVYGVLANFVAIPLTSIVIMPGLMLAVLAESVDGVGWVTAWARTGIELVILVAREVAAWDGAVVRWRALGDPAFGLMMFGLVWICLWRTRLRLAGLLPVAGGLFLAALTPAPDLFVSRDGGIMAVRLEDGRMAFSSLRRGQFTREMWLEETGLDTGGALPLTEVAPGPRLLHDCDEGLCRLVMTRGGRPWSVVWLKDWLDAAVLRRLCAESDILIAPRRLPGWCVPKRLKLDAPARDRLGAVSVRFQAGGALAVQGAEAQRGHHPWARAAW